MADLDLPVTAANIDRFYDTVFAPWVKSQGIEFLEIDEGHVRARLSQDAAQHLFTGAMCGQALMSAIDTVMTVAVSTRDRVPRGTRSQSTQFLRPAIGEDLILQAVVKKWGRSSAFGDVHVVLETSGDLVAHATCEFTF